MELTLEAASQEEAMELFGLGDRNLKVLREALAINLSARNGTIRMAGEKKPVEDAHRILTGLAALIRSGAKIPPDFVHQQLRELEAVPRGAGGPAGASSSPHVLPGGMRVEMQSIESLARSAGQAHYIRTILENDVVFCIGPAGTGKTFLAVHLAVGYLRGGDMRKIILCRPAVEAGEKLGFLPGDFQAKINPYLRPLYDALNEILDFDQVKRYVEREIIEVIPLAYMRGRTLNNSFIILDEGQNTTISQMKMFLTRMGMGSKIVVTGDITQVDLPPGMPSGLIHAKKIMKGVTGIGWEEMQKGDIVRHPLVKKIVELYEAGDLRQAQAAERGGEASGPADRSGAMLSEGPADRSGPRLPEGKADKEPED